MSDKEKISLPEIPDGMRTPMVDLLYRLLEQVLEENQKLKAEIIQLKDEIARLKNLPKRPKINPSKMDDEPKGSSGGKGDGEKDSIAKKEKPITEIKTIKVENLPKGSKFKGYRTYDVQDIEIIVKNIRYQLERWELPSGECITAELPKEVKGYHFGSALRSYIIYQHNNQLVTQPLLLEWLRELGISISSGEINRILNDEKEDFHNESIEILRAGLQESKYIQTDDTGARHKGKNGYCTQIGNIFFTYFASRRYKSRINFLEILRAGYEDYIFNESALDYMVKERLSKEWLDKLSCSKKHWKNKKSWERYLKEIGLKDERYKQMVTEGVLLGSIIGHGFLKTASILSDDAGQFNILSHALCWVHAERILRKLMPNNDLQRKEMNQVLNEFWKIYKKLKKYKLNPTLKIQKKVEKNFDNLFTKQTEWATLNNTLKRLMNNKEELLLVLERPEIPLHNNLSENDIRTYVKKRKISGGTRGDCGRDCRDTFASLKKTCRKLKISFWKYLNDRISKTNNIPKLPTLVIQAIKAGA